MQLSTWMKCFEKDDPHLAVISFLCKKKIKGNFPFIPSLSRLRNYKDDLSWTKQNKLLKSYKIKVPVVFDVFVLKGISPISPFFRYKDNTITSSVVMKTWKQVMNLSSANSSKSGTLLWGGGGEGSLCVRSSFFLAYCTVSFSVIKANRLKRLQESNCCSLIFFCHFFLKRMPHLEIYVRNICISKLPGGVTQEKQVLNFLSAEDGTVPLDVVTFINLFEILETFCARPLDFLTSWP